ncbi:MAG: cysteine hydrolase family protein [Nocardioides sp.]
MSTALLLIDMQVDYFNNPELARCRDSLVDACNALAETARRTQSPVIEVQTRHLADGSTWALNMLEDGAGMAIEGTPGIERLPGLAAADTVVAKTRDSAFHRTRLAAVLTEARVDHLVLCGVSTESCIAATATEAYARDLRVTLVRDGTASVDPDHHGWTLALLDEQYRQPALAAHAVRFGRRPATRCDG